jgi:hypothetical protein
MNRITAKRTQFTAITVLLLGVRPLDAQTGSSTLPSIGPSEVYVWNSNQNSSVAFTISGDACAPPMDTSLGPDATNTFNCPNAKSFWIRVATDSSTSVAPVVRQYRLENSHRYALIYNNSIDAWDVQEMPPN